MFSGILYFGNSSFNELRIVKNMNLDFVNLADKPSASATSFSFWLGNNNDED